ncbi:MAG: MoxR family ATPase [Ignavibacteriae bacterium]|nr:MoxR family ATPase [Ignavibacteriota bacterium]MCB9214775.1 MoxR family ATPase [Ignavibacteria bacterium]
MEQESFFSERTQLGDLTKGVEEIRKEIGKIIVGQREMVDLLIAAMLADGHVLIEGVPGVAKTLTAKLLARTLDIPYSRIQFTPDLMPSDILGTSVFNIKTNDFEYHEGPIFANLVLIDEVNRAPAKTQSALFEVMEERQITTEGKTRTMSLPFLVVATQNPIEQEGTYRLPEAQLDRFLFKIDVGYPTLEEETRIIREYHERGDVNDLSIVKPVIDASKIRALQETARRIRIDDNLVRYIAEIIARTRDNTALYLGASPRASLAVMSGAKGIAAMRGRDFVTPEDIKFVLIPTLRHRILLTPEKEMEGSRAEDVINLIVEGVEVPR